MKNKCPYCGNEFEDSDIFCSKCGQKIRRSNKEQNSKQKENNALEKATHSFLDNFDIKKEEYFDSKAKNILNNPLISYGIFILTLCIVFALSLNIFISKQHENKLKLQYKNMINKPQLIPELKEPKNYFELAQSLEKTEQFLSLYLKYSTDSKEKKEKIFTNYLDEINKLPHITSENITDEKLNICNSIKSNIQAKNCAKKLNNLYKNTAASAYSNSNSVYLFPDYKFIKRKYSKYMNSSIREFLNLSAKYSTPTSIGLDLKIPPKTLAKKIYDYEIYMNKTNNPYVKDALQNIIYSDFRKFIFTPSIYATTTQEMKKEFKDAYQYFIKSKKNSNLTPVIMSYLDKQKNYNDENFKNDYPYEIFEKTFEENVLESTLQDVFSKLRNNIFSKNSKTNFKYIFNTVTNNWSEYKKDTSLRPVEYVISDIDENNTISIYNSALSLFQELNTTKFSKLFMINSKLYIYNHDRLSISKINFNSESFNITILNANDVTSIFPGVNVINIDNYPSYNIYIEKDNTKEGFIILSKYSQGWEKYILEATKGTIKQTILPNMFIVDSLYDTEIALHSTQINPDEMSEMAPTYKLIIRTKGQKPVDTQEKNEITQYDERTSEEEASEQSYKPTFKPKIGGNDNKINEDKPVEDLLNAPPIQKLEPPEE